MRNATRLIQITFLLFLFSAVFLFQEGHARDLHGRLGLGFSNQYSVDVPALSIKYALSRSVAASLSAGVVTSSPLKSATGVKFYKNIFYETNLNFYTMFGAALLLANEESGIEFLGGFGTEFFIPGIESLGLSIELGAAFTNLSGSFVLKTMGASFLGAGIHFYF